MKNVFRKWVFLICAAFLPCVCLVSGEKSPAGLTIAVAALPADSRVLENPAAAEWAAIGAKTIALNRTPRLFETEPPSELLIRDLQLRIAGAGGKMLVRMNWRDETRDSADLTPASGTPYEGRFHKVPTDSTDRFFDAAAVMVPRGGAATGTPSLQMGDAQNPVTVYYWNSARGAMLMEAAGRETTKRTGGSFPAFAKYKDGEWTVVLELPALPSGTPLALAVWNGSQQDRDGRKYFSIWHWLE